MERKYAAGAESSEFKQVKLAQRVGLAVLALGILLALGGVYLGAWFVVLGGVGLAYVGGELVEKTVAAYAQSRGKVKAAAAAPEQKVISPSVRVGAGRL